DAHSRGACQDRGTEAAELASRIAVRYRPGTRAGRRLGHQDLRHRADHRGMPAPDGGSRRERHRPHRLARRAAGRPNRADAPVRADPDVRRRHERDPARHDRYVRARPALPALISSEEAAVDFAFTHAQEELSSLSRQILADYATPDRLAELEQAGHGFDTALWAKLAGAGILAAALPEGAGGDGYGLAEQCSIMIEIGRTVARVPYLSSIVLGAGAIARFGTDEQVTRWAVPAGA